jgi:hypothetical protein
MAANRRRVATARVEIDVGSSTRWCGGESNRDELGRVQATFGNFGEEMTEQSQRIGLANFPLRQFRSCGVDGPANETYGRP